MLDDKDQYIAACIAVKDALTDTTGIDAELDRLFNEMDVISELTRKCVTENATSAQDQQAYTARYNEYVARYDKTKARYDILLKQRDARCKKASDIDRFMETISARGQMITEFDGGLWLAVLEKAVVHEDGTIVFCFYNGTEIPG